MLMQKSLNAMTKKGVMGLVALLLALALGFLPVSAFAQEKELKVSHMRVSIWPEYDEPRVLGIFQGQLADKTTFPAPVKFLLPKDAEVNQACALTESGEHQCQVYETAIEGDFKAVTYKLPLRTFFLDFYYNPLAEGTNKSFDYVFKAPYSVDTLEMEVQQPLKATDFKVSPEAMSQGSDEKGFKYARYTYPSVPDGQDYKFSVSYTKTDPKPSVEKPPQGGAPQGQAATGGAGGFTFSPLVILLSITVSIMLALVGYIIVTARGGGGKAVRPAYSHAGSGKSKRPVKYNGGQGKGGTGQARAGRFCTSCGSATEQGDNFCPNCGKKLRR